MLPVIIFISLLILGVVLSSFGMLRGLAFYGTGGATGTAGTFFDPLLGATVTTIPHAGEKANVTIKGVTLFSNTQGKNIYGVIAIGQDSDVHKLTIFPQGDGDMDTQTMTSPYVALGDFVVGENSNLAVTLYDPGAAALFSGVLWYEDHEPVLPIPAGRIVTIHPATSGADATTSHASYGTVPARNTDCVYYICGVEVHPEDELIQVASLHSSDKGLCAVAPPKGRLYYPTCPLRADGLATLIQKIQVQTAAEVDLVWFAVEVPKGTTPVTNSDVKPSTPFLPSILVQATRKLASFGRR